MSIKFLKVRRDLTMNKIFFILSCYIILNLNAYAENSYRQSATNTHQAPPAPAPAPATNNPTVGSRAGSNQLFGNQKLSKKPDSKLYDDSKKELNSSTVGSKSGSEQVFGNQQLQSKTGQNSSNNQKRHNSPTVGSRSGSEQMFGHP